MSRTIFEALSKLAFFVFPLPNGPIINTRDTQNSEDEGASLTSRDGARVNCGTQV
jgi:hypothetical protein